MLDEPTSALDSVSEAAVTRALSALFAGRTVIVIAHRLQTVKECDEIILLGAEGVSARGTHSELMASSPEYAAMVDLQSGRLG
jgi:ABC-type multidrug transport system fused ATPase/permease subunit